MAKNFFWLMNQTQLRNLRLIKVETKHHEYNGTDVIVEFIPLVEGVMPMANWEFHTETEDGYRKSRSKVFLMDDVWYFESEVDNRDCDGTHHHTNLWKSKGGLPENLGCSPLVTVNATPTQEWKMLRTNP